MACRNGAAAAAEMIQGRVNYPTTTRSEMALLANIVTLTETIDSPPVRLEHTSCRFCGRDMSDRSSVLQPKCL
jgi:hypothetical protein